MDGQEVTDLAIDPTGLFASVVVNYAATSGLPTGSCPLGITCAPGTTSGHKDVYACDFGASGQGCVSAGHSRAPSTSLNTAQAVDTTSYAVTGGLNRYYAVAGPGDLMSLWSSSSATPIFEVAAPADALGSTPLVTNVTIEPNGQHVFFASTTTGGAGTLYYYDATGKLVWSFGLLDGQDAPTRATSMAWARNGGRVAIGTPAGLELLVPTNEAPRDRRPFHFFNTSPVNEVAISADGLIVAAATDGYTYFLRVDPATGEAQRPVFSRNTGTTTAVALSRDGERFASVAGGKISFFRALHNSAIAEFLGEYDAGATVSDLAYDATGRILVAVAGNNVLGFTPGKTQPAWTFDGTARGLDGPLRKVRVSDGWFDGSRHAQYDATRIVVAGRTKVMAFDVPTSATATASAPGGNDIVPGTAVPFRVTVTNTGALADNYTFVVQTPIASGATTWTATSAPSLALQPDQAGVAQFNVTAPLGQAPGTYAVVVEIHAQGYNGRPACGSASDTIACATLSLDIARSISLAIPGAEERRQLKQGSEDTVTLAITNNGNAEGVVNLSATQTLTRGSPWALRFTPGPQVRIPAGATANVNVVVDAPTEAVSGDRNVITVYAKEGETAVATKVITAYVDALFGSEMTASNESLQLAPGEVRTLSVSLRNTGNTEDTYNVTFTMSPAGATNDWRVILDHEKVTVPLGQVRQVGVTVRPLVAEPREATVTITAESLGDPRGSESTYKLALFAKPAVTTPTGKSNPLPDVGLVGVVGLLALAALARRLGGRP